MATINKNQNRITIDLDPLENKAINYLVKHRGPAGLRESLQGLIDSRVQTVIEDERRRVYRIFDTMTQAEKDAYLAKELTPVE